MAEATEPPAANPPFDWFSFAACPTDERAAFLRREFQAALTRGEKAIHAAVTIPGDQFDEGSLRDVYYATKDLQSMLIHSGETLIELAPFAAWLSEQMDRARDFLTE